MKETFWRKIQAKQVDRHSPGAIASGVMILLALELHWRFLSLNGHASYQQSDQP
jgi:hypothetical protein